MPILKKIKERKNWIKSFFNFNEFVWILCGNS